MPVDLFTDADIERGKASNRFEQTLIRKSLRVEIENELAEKTANEIGVELDMLEFLAKTQTHIISPPDEWKQAKLIDADTDSKLIDSDSGDDGL